MLSSRSSIGALFLLCALAICLVWVRPGGAQSPAGGADASLQAIVEGAAASLGWAAPEAIPAEGGIALRWVEQGAPCEQPASGRYVEAGATASTLLVLSAGEVPSPWDLSGDAAVQVDLNGAVADYWLSSPVLTPGIDWQGRHQRAHLSWLMGGQRLAASVETNCPLGVNVEEAILPLAQALFTAASSAGLVADAQAAGWPGPTPTPPAAGIEVEWSPRYLAVVGGTGELLITLRDAAGEPAAGRQVVIERIEPPGAAVEGLTGESGALRCAIEHDSPGVRAYRYAVRALGVERIVEVPVIAARFTLEGNPTTGGAYRGVVADGSSTLAVQVDVPDWPGQVRLQSPTYGTLESVDGQRLQPGELLLDPQGRAEFVYVPPVYLDAVSSTLEIDGEPGSAAAAHGAVDTVPLTVVDDEGDEFTVPLEILVFRPPVLLVHGLADGPESLQPLANHLAEAGYDADLGSYVPGEWDADAATASLARVLAQRIRQRLEAYAHEGIKVARADLVTHSTGGLAARYYVQDASLYRDNVRKLIMLAPPNHGTGLSDRPVRAVQAWWQERLGARASEFVAGAEVIRALNDGEARGDHLRPGVEYAVLAGRLTAEEFIDPHLPRDPAWAFTSSDGVVTVSSARLAGVPLYAVDGACHSAALNALTPRPRPEHGIAQFPETWARILGLLSAPIEGQPVQVSRAAVIHCEECSWQQAPAGTMTTAENLPPGSMLRAGGRALVGLYDGDTLWALLSVAPGSEIVVDDPSPEGARILLRQGGVRCRTVGRQARPGAFSVLVGEPPAMGRPFAPSARAWDLGADLVVQTAEDGVHVFAVTGKVVAETQNADGVALGRLLHAGEAADVRAGETPEKGTAPEVHWWDDDYYSPPPPASAATVRRLGMLALGVLGLALVAGIVSWADHGHLEPALEELRSEGQSLRYDLADGAVRRPDLHALTTQDSEDRWWSYDPLRDTWSVAVGDEWRPATPPRFSSRKLWLLVANLLLVVGLALGAIALFLR